MRLDTSDLERLNKQLEREISADTEFTEADLVGLIGELLYRMDIVNDALDIVAKNLIRLYEESGGLDRVLGADED
ncbi:MAG: hypothetical protein IKY94_05215 [Lachnospiraceae bacterium]|nr:hypothetical protein [Lachnospiraceae bacterium]